MEPLTLRGADPEGITYVNVELPDHLPLTVLRRQKCVLETTKQAVLDRAAQLAGRSIECVRSTTLVRRYSISSEQFSGEAASQAWPPTGMVNIGSVWPKSRLAISPPGAMKRVSIRRSTV